jgi:hypothetical protein
VFVSWGEHQTSKEIIYFRWLFCLKYCHDPQ